MKTDALKISILPDGTIKMETDDVGQANHASADRFSAMMARLAGGATETTRKGAGQTHGHVHHAREAGH